MVIFGFQKDSDKAHYIHTGIIHEGHGDYDCCGRMLSVRWEFASME